MSLRERQEIQTVLLEKAMTRYWRKVLDYHAKNMPITFAPQNNDMLSSGVMTKTRGENLASYNVSTTSYQRPS